MSSTGVCGEVVHGGCRGLCGLDQINWGGPAGACYECWRCSPFCGRPDCYGCLVCCVNWTCCSCCASAKLYASSLGEPVACWPHCCCVMFCGFCSRLFTRYNLRKKAGVKGNILGDCCCICCCNVCSMCQELRSVNVCAWRVVPDCTMPQCYRPGCRFIV
uniref:Protein PLANT CADMIUM RESISTANCE 2 n=1 Tax=Lygus hesperus TaxID=30085 RepID=A0A0A9XTV2_LYGHE